MLREFFKNGKIKRLKKKILNLKKEECSRRHWVEVYENTKEYKTCGCEYINSNNIPDKIMAEQARIEINFLEKELKEYFDNNKI